MIIDLNVKPETTKLFGREYTKEILWNLELGGDLKISSKSAIHKKKN